MKPKAELKMISNLISSLTSNLTVGIPQGCRIRMMMKHHHYEEIPPKAKLTNQILPSLWSPLIRRAATKSQGI
jgi:hypothetical protein